MNVIRFLCLGWLVCLPLTAAEPGRDRAKGRPHQPAQKSACLDVPAHACDVVLGRPTRATITLSLLTYQDTEGCVAYGTQRGGYPAQTPARRFTNGQPTELVIGSLEPDTQYYYQLRLQGTNATEGAFHTQRPPGSAFTFTVIADSHLDDRVSASLYQRTLAGARADAPDFHLDLGDTFMSEKHDSRQHAARQYLAQRYYFGQLCASAPLFLTLGNHDGENPRGRGGEAASLALWSNSMRKRYFPNPVPDDFYSGNPAEFPGAGLLQDYYAWEWGDALFIVLDPFWFTREPGGARDGWTHSLGEAQYQWLKQTLETSRARFKFIFIHHLVGGLNDQCRGGAEAAAFYEWGGRNAGGRDGFQSHRPGWPAPIHQLLVRHHASIVFHGHDHLYAKQDLDGVVYQEVPQPGNPGGNRPPRSAAEYGYTAGTILGGSGYLRVRITPAEASVEYLRAGEHDFRSADKYVVPAAATK